MLEDRTLRTTRQRKIILEELRKVKYHPTADDLYLAVRRRLPRISLGTVYRNLDLLSRAGLIQKLEVGGTRKRFDGDTEGHCHRRCVACGKVEDVYLRGLDAVMRRAVKAMTDYEVVSYHVEFVGYCRDCRSKAKRTGGIR
ncbi:MAG: transcriptional repressor [Candidatus Eisenbacteria bacterium]|nr:transcriptional repressor [Candidatus Eisenbacteria bacterium]